MEENQTSVGTAEASDPEDDTLTYSISGNELQIDSSTGVITFVSAPDFETKVEYTATVTVSDASLNDSQEIIVNITDVDDTAPVITTSSVESSIEEGDTALGSVSANETVTWSLGGTDVDYVSISSDGTLTLNSEADYETKISYSFTVTATDAVGNTTTISALVISVNDDGKVFICHVTGRGTNGKTETLEVAPDAVDAHLNHGDSLGACDSDVDIISPEITSGATGIDLDENSGSGQTIYTIIANDDVAVTSYAIAGTDPSLLSVNSSTGVVSLTADPDYETKNSYSFTVTASDAAGNTSDPTTVTFSINDLDDTIPVITLTGSDVSQEVGGSYTDAGATALDNIDGDITSNIATVNPVDPSTVGVYTVTYNVSDAAGNPAVEVTRTVTITSDVTVPVITLTGSDVSQEVGGSYTDAGATALDNIDGDITSNIATVNPVDPSTVGVYTVTYNVSDAAGNPAVEVTRTVTITSDVTVPVITLTGSDVSQEVGGSYTDAGATALDNIDGDITSNIATVNPVDPSTVGVYTVTYNVSDAAGNPAVEVTRTVTITSDVTVPVITLTGSDVSQEVGGSYTDAGATALDNIDGDITSNIATVNPVDPSTVGVYTVTYNVSDAAGNPAVEVTRTVTITSDVTVPVITLTGSDVSQEVGGSYTDAGATALDNIDGDITSNIATVNPVDPSTVGVYTVTYNVSDAAGNPAVEVTRTVTITSDVTVPVITSGTTGTNLDENSGSGQPIYTIIATDNVAVTSYAIAGTDVSLLSVNTSTGVVTLIADPDYETKPSYSFTVTASDAAGNTSDPTTVTFSINDLDDTAPVITTSSIESSIEEGDTALGSVSANETVTWSVGGTDASYLSIATNGTLTLDTAADYETKTSYSFTVTAIDAVGNTTTTSVLVISVNDDGKVFICHVTGRGTNGKTETLEVAPDAVDAHLNHGDSLGVCDSDVDYILPEITSGTTGTNLDENSGAGQTIYTIIANDDVAVTSYAIAGTDPSLLSVNSSTGVVSLTADPDYETKNSYSFTVTASDAASNTSDPTTVTFSINDLDDTIPVITLTGSDVSQEVGGSYTDAGATALDNIDGDITSNIATVNPVDPSTVGVYTVTYNVSDAAGNPAVEVTRTVTITSDVTVPVITLTGSDVSQEVGGSYTDAGATALDNIDGDITSNIATVNPVDPSTVGVYTVTYNVSDAAGNPAVEVTRTVTITSDVTVPVITLTGSDVSQEVGGSYTDAGATALDNIDGDITSNIATVNPVDPSTVGVYTVTYNVSDAAGNPAVEVTRTVTITSDVTVPVITLTGSDVSQEVGGSYTDAGATALDNIDGDITSNIATVNPVDPSTVGVYTVTYNVSDAAGNPAVEVTRTVTITSDVTVPVITLTGSDVSQEVGGSYTDAGATALDNIDGDITSNIATVNPVDPSTVGVYTVTYNVSDAAGNPAVEVTRTVTITSDVTVPVITLTGSDVSQEVGGSYTDAGATALDNIDGDITSNIATVNPVDPSTVGVYTVTYNVSDAAGNPAVEVTRTVTITSDVTVPVITLTGSDVSQEVGGSYTDAGATALDNIDGDITSNIATVNPVDPSTVGVYTVTYNVSDAAGNPAVEVTRTVTITSDVTVPVITSGTTGTNLDENSGSGQPIYTIIATDNVAVTSYAIAGTDVSLLSVNTSTGVVTLIADPDYETKPSYSFTVTASDAAGNTSDPTTVTFSINDLDDTAPVITTSSIESSIEEGDTALGSVSANETVTWSVGGTDASYLSIATNGTLTLDTAADYETKTSYSFTVTAIDAVGNTTTTSVLVISVNDDGKVFICHVTGRGTNGKTETLEVAPDAVDAHLNHGDSLGVCDSDVDYILPEITSGTTGTNLDENSGAGQTIYTIIANDDVAVTSYAIAGTDPSLLSVNSSTGVVSLTADPDYETKNSYSFTVTASDAASNTSDPTTVTFSINDLDDTIPVITLTGSDVSQEVGGSYTDAGATALDNIDGDITSNIATVNPVDPSTVGVYTVTYNVSDAAGNPAVEVTRTVTITSDVTVPVITLTGSDVSQEVGGSYTDAGATALDNIDGDITSNIATVNPVDPSTVGVYTVTYNVSDAAGNPAVEVTRTVTITSDVTVPVITLTGSDVSQEVGGSYTDAGATALDNIDGDITSNIATVNPVDPSTVGVYTVTYNVSDAAGNPAVEVTRTVTITSDVTVPVITLTGSDVSQEVGGSYTDAGATALDNIDGDITSNIATVNPVDPSTVGVYTVTYNVSDAAGNPAVEVTRTVTITSDVTVPVITLTGSDVSQEVGGSYTDAGATALDNIDGDITSNIATVNPVDPSTVGVYTVTYNVSDAAGNPAVEVTRTVTITSDVTVPVITLTGSDVSQEVGGSYTDAGATALDNIDGDITSNIATVNPVDPSTVGVYTVTYNVSDAAGNPAVEVTRTVTITSDVTVPVITLTGSDVSQEVGGSYTDAGATALDNIDGDITSNIATVNPVDPSTVGVYTVTYNVSDAAGNPAVEVTRTVTITSDVTVPVITSGTTGTNLDENSGSGQPIYTIIATDNVAVTSYAIAGTDVSLLSVNTSTGVVTLIADPDYETKPSYSFTVTASDAAGNTSDPTTVTFSINDLDDTAPVITTSSIESSIEEGDTALGSVSANETVTWSVGGTDASYLSIATNGTLTLDTAADYETKTSYSFTVTAIDAVGNTTTTSVLVISVNDDGKVFICHVTGRGTNGKTETLEVAPDAVDAHLNHGDSLGVCDSDVDYILPEITSGTTGTNLDENSGAGQTIYTIIANDDVAVTSYAIAGTDPSLLSVNSSTGVVSLTADPDYETKNSYSFTVTASDAASNTSDPTTVTFSINDLDDTIPVITLTGSDVSQEVGGSYTDAGATALDNIDGDITSNIATVNPVDPSTVGVYTVTYNVSDAAGNPAVEVTRTVTITSDVTVPVITLTGSDVSQEVGGSYTDAGATALDNIDGDITSNIATVNPVDPSTVGVYTVTYNVSDAAGNPAVEVTRTVTITSDVTVPVITLTGSDVSQEVGGSYTDAGATALDNIDGDITSNIATVNPVDPSTVGVYTVTYNVSDAAGNPAVEVTRTVTITSDVTVPVITLTGSDVSQEVGGSYTDAGATALDNIDGDITSNIATVNPVDPSTVGVYTVTYNVSDAAGNPAVEVTRTVTITSDVTVPVITLTGSDVSQEVGGSYTDAGATALDNIDGDITSNIATVNPVDPSTVGVYTVTYNVSDAAGNPAVEVTRTVTITSDVTVPVITLTGSDVSQEVGGSYTDAGATALDNIDGDITSNIATVNPVDPSTVGVYTVTYNVSDAAGNPAVEVTRTVTITSDVTVPVITLTGSDVSQEVGGSYTDAGATALDNIDGDITSNIATVNPVDPSTVGVYTVTYNVSDAAGNPAVEVTRTVTITSDVTVPVITLTGSDVSQEVGGSYTDAGATALDNIDGDITSNIATVNPVDPSTVGVYTVTYNVSDAAGNPAVEVTRTVTITSDVTVPVITLTGSDVSQEVGGSYTDAGATALDNIDGDITSNIATVNPVDPSTVGVYTVTYNVSDAAGNPAVEVTRTVTITSDVTVPVITLTGSDVSQEVGGSYTDAGATALDNIDGDITSNIATVNPVDPSTVGVYTVTYNVSDAAGNPAVEVTRTVTITSDVTVPVITLTGSDVSQEVGGSYTDAGATALDNIDGDITSNIATVNPVDPSTVGVYTVTYNVSDAAGNPAVEVTRTVTITSDVTVPVITLTGSDVSQEVGGSYTDAGATALDNIDGDITSNIATVNPVDPSTVGVYTVTYNVSDAAGNPAVEVTRTVTITSDVTVPVITLTGSDVSQEVGGSYTDAGATALDNIDGDITSNIATVNPVDPSTVGVYTVTYNVSDAAGNPAVEVTRTVTITSDVTVPVITLTGSDVSQEVGGSYTDAGATALDNIDGDITSNIATVNPVDPSTVGVYTVTYNVSDAAGNPAVEVTRTVTITSDVTVPVITLTGSDVSQEVGEVVIPMQERPL